MSMRHPLRACALAAVVLVSWASAALAEPVDVTPAGAITATSLGKVTFGASPRIECNLTLAGSLASGPIELTAGRVFGSISEVRWASCSGGSVSRVLGLPWTVSYAGLSGSLERGVSAFRFELGTVAFQLSTFFEIVNCLYAGAVGVSAAVGPSENGVDWRTGLLTLARESRLAFVSGSELCPAEGAFAGTLSLAPTQTILARQRARLSVTQRLRIPAGSVEANLAMRNTVAAGGHEMTISRVVQVPVAGAFPVAVTCDGRRVAPGGECTTVVRYTGAPGARPVETEIWIYWRDGILADDRIESLRVIAE